MGILFVNHTPIMAFYLRWRKPIVIVVEGSHFSRTYDKRGDLVLNIGENIVNRAKTLLATEHADKNTFGDVPPFSYTKTIRDHFGFGLAESKMLGDFIRERFPTVDMDIYRKVDAMSLTRKKRAFETCDIVLEVGRQYGVTEYIFINARGKRFPYKDECESLFCFAQNSEERWLNTPNDRWEVVGASTDRPCSMSVGDRIIFRSRIGQAHTIYSCTPNGWHPI